MRRSPQNSSARTIEVKGDQYDGLRTQAVMLGPEDPLFRRAFVATGLVRGNDWDLQGPPVLVERQLLADLLEAPAWPALLADVGARTKDAAVAGYVLMGLFMMWRFPEVQGSRNLGGVSLNKAFSFCAYIAREHDWKYGDGTGLPRGETKIKECWHQYRSVAHFWAAHAWNQAFPVPNKMSLYRENLPEFLTAARYFQLFGREPILDKKASKTKESALPEDLWQVPDGFGASLLYDADPSVYEDSLLAEALRSYASK
ncbi:hypothetical protein ACN9MJ_10440 [Acidovorax facilis]|uniref:hypothetical protein n=1 Tax=Acidovorax facilis TaxID=12917 RepID=UPI003CF70FDE